MEIGNWESDAFIRLDPGEEIHTALQEVANDVGCHSAVVTSGIGRVRNVDIGYLDTEGIYQRIVLKGPVELLSMQGNIATLDGEPFTHLHVVVSDNDHAVHGGHLFSATIHVTGEIHLRILDNSQGATFGMTRCHIEGSQFKPLNFSEISTEKNE